MSIARRDDILRTDWGNSRYSWAGSISIGMGLRWPPPVLSSRPLPPMPGRFPIRLAAEFVSPHFTGEAGQQ